MKTQIEGPLLEVLYDTFKDSSKKKIKSYLKTGCVYVNGKQVTKYDFFISKGSYIEIKKINKTHQKSPLPILFEDDSFLVVEKPAGLLSIATEKEKEQTAYHKMRTFVNMRGRKEKLFILHRLDRETSGILIFVKDEKLKHLLQQNWTEFVKNREYFAIVSGNPKEKDVISLCLDEGKDLKMYVSKNGKKCITKYKKLLKKDSYALLKVQIETGRKNQIRASLAYQNLPIVGDLKYGNKKGKRLYLHASNIEIEHPITHQKYHFKSKEPREFKKFFATSSK